ncbi:ModD protein [Rhodoplanes sp. TEM]|uniref:Putative pyrophosphorylase ModD n=1 Tax=Rhodoplanes tepidamans TaxID=200616 RepID=A0ABT5JCI7_RHOTP|nr:MULTISPECIES: ModD protein [Rhodoplanes]MDC7787410.1 ModD protein [Rhodoplanes tepidamans]MDC7985529.1 ModD protein [Rhodoplanes sp. TEM]MDQ0358104.1 molybdenum transport protein [Rhodoplanes tepidamans]
MLPALPDHALDALLADDVPLGDLTTHALGIAERPARMTFTARDPLVVALSEEAARLLGRAGAQVELFAPSGTEVGPGGPILAAHGPAGALHRGWKVAQTLVEIASGIATRTRAIVAAARAVAPDVAVACTRKAVPGAKALSIKAILAGGAVPHRLGLSETILVFDQHRRFLADLAPAEIVARLRRSVPEKTVVVEVDAVDEGIAWARAGADVIQAEKFSPEAIAALVAALKEAAPATIVAAAGGIGPDNAAAYAAAGARVLVTSAPYTAKPRDVQVRIAPA